MSDEYEIHDLSCEGVPCTCEEPADFLELFRFMCEALEDPGRPARSTGVFIVQITPESADSIELTPRGYVGPLEI